MIIITVTMRMTLMMMMTKRTCRPGTRRMFEMWLPTSLGLPTTARHIRVLIIMIKMIIIVVLMMLFIMIKMIFIVVLMMLIMMVKVIKLGLPATARHICVLMMQRQFRFINLTLCGEIQRCFVAF